MSEALHAFLSYDKEPEKDVYIKRFNTHFKVRAITNDDYYEIQEQATHLVGKGANAKKEIDDKTLDTLLVAKGVVEPDFSNAQVLQKFNAVDAADAVGKSLYVGELKALQEAILRLSGFGDGEQIEEAKN